MLVDERDWGEARLEGLSKRSAGILERCAPVSRPESADLCAAGVRLWSSRAAKNGNRAIRGKAKKSYYKDEKSWFYTPLRLHHCCLGRKPQPRRPSGRCSSTVVWVLGRRTPSPHASRSG